MRYVEVAFFFAVPALAATVLLSAGFRITDVHSGPLLTALSIFAALLLNLLVVLQSIIQKEQAPVGRSSAWSTLIEETYANVAYSILVALAGVVLLTVGILVASGSSSPPLLFPSLPAWLAFLGRVEWIKVVSSLFSWVVYFLVLNFVLTLFMVLKRVHVLLRTEFSR